MDSSRASSLPRYNKLDTTSVRSHLSRSVARVSAHVKMNTLMPPTAQLDLTVRATQARLATVQSPRQAPSFTPSKNTRIQEVGSLESPERRKFSETIDATFRRTGLSVGRVAGTENNNPFGHSFYRSPKEDVKYRISIGNSTNNEKMKSFVELEAKRL